MKRKAHPTEPGHLGFLDGVRGLAALWVLIGHCMIWGGWFWAKFPEPLIAVDVFMFVSGYLMLHQWNRRHGIGDSIPPGAAAEFWVRRFFRIVPVYYLALVVMFLFWDRLADGMMALQAAHPTRWAGEVAYDIRRWDPGMGNLLLRLSFVFGLLPSHAATSFMGDWSLSLEMQYYAVFPFLVVWLRRRGPLEVAGIAVLIALATRETTLRLQPWVPAVPLIYPLPSLLALKLPVFLVGMMLAEVNRRFAAEPGPSGLALALALFLASLSSFHVVAVAALAFLNVGGVPFLAPAVRKWQERLAWALGNRAMLFLADASYSVYLFHSLVLAVVGGSLIRWPGFAGLSGQVRVLVLVIVVAVITYPLSFLLHYLVERPGIELGRRIARRWVTRPVPAVADPRLPGGGQAG